MSRSYKKFPAVQDAKRKTGVQFKRETNRRIRRAPLDALPQKGDRFKNQYGNPYDRCDCLYYETYREYLAAQHDGYFRYFHGCGYADGPLSWRLEMLKRYDFADTKENYFKWKKRYLMK